MSWSASVRADSYVVYWSTTSGTGSSGTAVAVSRQSYVHPLLTNGTPYYYVVAAVNTAGESAVSTQVSAAPALITIASLPTFADTNLDACIRAAGATNVSDLTFLNCASSNISSLAGIEVLTSITYLGLQSNSVSDVTPLIPLPSLDALDLKSNGITDTTALAAALNQCPALTYLALNSNTIIDVTPLAGITGLTTLHANNNSITSVAGLATAASLRKLRLNGNSIADAAPLASLINLTLLQLSSNSGIANLASLAALTNLRSLSLASTGLSDIDVVWIGGMSSLNDNLNLASNSITDVTPLNALQNLSWLYLYENDVQTGVSGLTATSGIHLTDNPNLPCADVIALDTALDSGDGGAAGIVIWNTCI